MEKPKEKQEKKIPTMCKVRNNLIFKGKGEAGTHCDRGWLTAQTCDVYIGAPHLEGPCPH